MESISQTAPNPSSARRASHHRSGSRRKPPRRPGTPWWAYPLVAALAAGVAALTWVALGATP